MLKIGYPFPMLDFKAWAQLFSRCRFLREAEIESKRASLDCPPSKWKLNRTTQLTPVSHPAVLLQGPGCFFRTNHVLQSRILS